MSRIYTVQEAAKLLKENLETRFPFIWVRGQVSNLSRPGSGHVYFTLKDETACLDAVWFRQQQRQSGEFNPLTGEVYEQARHDLAQNLQNGEDILCAGKITLYPPQGRLQMQVELAQPIGVGLLQQEFERLKQELLARGWFDLARKRPLPPNPTRVAVVTAPSGAVIHDFLRIARTRGHGGEIRIYPSLVQGDGAPESIVSAMQEIASQAWAELIVLIRGGGSLEDLWAFNSEKVAQAIVDSPVPVITGIGHEPDNSIADWVADMSAATPSHAAQLIWSEKNILAQDIDMQEVQLRRQIFRQLSGLKAKLTCVFNNMQHLAPRSRLERSEERLASLSARLKEKFSFLLQNREQRLALLSGELAHALSEADLRAIEFEISNLISGMKTQVLTRIANLELGLVPESHIFSLLNQRLMRYEEKLTAPDLLSRLVSRRLEQMENALALETTRLNGLNPLLPLARGYAVVRDACGQVVLNSAQTRIGQNIKIILGRGGLDAEITNIHSEER